jgi:predicted hydrocarbon binding protein
MLKEENLGKPKRTSLGYEVPLEIVRLILLSLEEILEENAPPTFQMLGRAVGRALGAKNLGEVPEVLRVHKLGLVEISKHSEDRVTVRFKECIGCSGMKDYNEAISQLERGIIAGVLEGATGATVSIKESKCCTQGNDYCEFDAVLMP